MASMASQLTEEVTAHAQSDILEDAREIFADGIYFPNNLRTRVICVPLIRFSASSGTTQCWQIKPDKQRTYNVTPRRVRITTVATEKR